jgi:hypothetical protein
MKKGITCIAALLFIFCSILPVYAQNSVGSDLRSSGPSGEAMIADLILVRPLSIIALALGAVVSIAATPFAVASDTTPMVYDKLIVEPYDFTVCRPLGSGF